jgi:hypothetical protein
MLRSVQVTVSESNELKMAAIHSGEVADVAGKLTERNSCAKI